ncbi:hypothetical protein [Microvirga sp. G4-2]|uniref:hypothetical protein n=1 Tax=Microvirga sp. G4-2 TaxID=3434467 RepID=UPI00404497BC
MGYHSEPTPYIDDFLPADGQEHVTVTMRSATGKTERMIELTRRSAKDILGRMVLGEAMVALLEGERPQARDPRRVRRRRAAMERKGRGQ